MGFTWIIAKLQASDLWRQVKRNYLIEPSKAVGSINFHSIPSYLDRDYYQLTLTVVMFIITVMNAASETRHTLDDLSALTDQSIRTIRYYIQQGLVDRPIGEKRGAYYTARHVEQLLSIRKWQAAGVSLERIREILQEPPSGLLPPPKPRNPGTLEVWSHLVIADGVELTLEPGRAGLSPEAVRTLARSVMALYQQIRDDDTPSSQSPAQENPDDPS